MDLLVKIADGNVTFETECFGCGNVVQATIPMPDWLRPMAQAVLLPLIGKGDFQGARVNGIYFCSEDCVNIHCERVLITRIAAQSN
jgi:hypothetical protein